MNATRDKHEQIAWDGHFVVCVLGNGRDFEFIDLDAEPLPDAARRNLCERGYYFIGTVGIVAGQPRVALDEPLEPDTVSALSQAYIQHVKGAMKAAPWPVRPDMREN